MTSNELAIYLGSEYADSVFDEWKIKYSQYEFSEHEVFINKGSDYGSVNLVYGERTSYPLEIKDIRIVTISMNSLEIDKLLSDFMSYKREEKINVINETK